MGSKFRLKISCMRHQFPHTGYRMIAGHFYIEVSDIKRLELTD